MENNLSIKESTLPLIREQRLEYLYSLPCFQDIFLEFMVRRSRVFELKMNDEQAGYFLIDGSIMIEFFLKEKYTQFGIGILNRALASAGVNEIYCKSFDRLLMDCCRSLNAESNVVGYLYRGCSPSVNFYSDALTVRFADHNDLPFLLSQDDEVFEPRDLLELFIKNKGIFLFMKENRIAGCGFLTKVHESFNFYDIGVWTDPGSRNQGIGRQIISYLREYCIRKNLVPVCGCSVDNIASQKILEKNGFTCRHELIDFIITPAS